MLSLPQASLHVLKFFAASFLRSSTYQKTKEELIKEISDRISSDVQFDAEVCAQIDHAFDSAKSRQALVVFGQGSMKVTSKLNKESLEVSVSALSMEIFLAPSSAKKNNGAYITVLTVVGKSEEDEKALKRIPFYCGQDGKQRCLFSIFTGKTHPGSEIDFTFSAFDIKFIPKTKDEIKIRSESALWTQKGNLKPVELVKDVLQTRIPAETKAPPKASDEVVKSPNVEPITEEEKKRAELVTSILNSMDNHKHGYKVVNMLSYKTPARAHENSYRAAEAIGLLWPYFSREKRLLYIPTNDLFPSLEKTLESIEEDVNTVNEIEKLEKLITTQRSTNEQDMWNTLNSEKSITRLENQIEAELKQSPILDEDKEAFMLRIQEKRDLLKVMKQTYPQAIRKVNELKREIIENCKKQSLLQESLTSKSTEQYKTLLIEYERSLYTALVIRIHAIQNANIDIRRLIAYGREIPELSFGHLKNFLSDWLKKGSTQELIALSSFLKRRNPTMLSSITDKNKYLQAVEPLLKNFWNNADFREKSRLVDIFLHPLHRYYSSLFDLVIRKNEKDSDSPSVAEVESVKKALFANVPIVDFPETIFAEMNLHGQVDISVDMRGKKNFKWNLYVKESKVEVFAQHFILTFISPSSSLLNVKVTLANVPNQATFLLLQQAGFYHDPSSSEAHTYAFRMNVEHEAATFLWDTLYKIKSGIASASSQFHIDLSDPGKQIGLETVLARQN